MDAQSRAVFLTTQAACMSAKLAGMQEQNLADRAAGRTPTYRPEDFESLPDQYQLGHNAVITYLLGQ